MNIGIIGQGFVGSAVYKKFKNFFNVYTFDLKKELSNSTLDNLLDNCAIVFLCLPTPMNADGSCNTDIIDNILSVINKKNKHIIINKSTITPGKTEYFNKKYKNLEIVFNPEFLTERNAVEDYNNQNRIILGGSKKTISKIKSIFSKVFPNAILVKTGSKYAEMIKYLTNCFLATKVSFANEMYDICESLGIDYDKVIEYAKLDDRIGNSHWNVPGPDGDFGFGGHCLPKDLNAIIHISKKIKSTNNVIKAVLKTNDNKRNFRDWEKMKGRAVN